MFSRERHNVQMLRASLSEIYGFDFMLKLKDNATYAFPSSKALTITTVDMFFGQDQDNTLFVIVECHGRKRNRSITNVL